MEILSSYSSFGFQKQDLMGGVCLYLQVSQANVELNSEN